MRIDANKHGIRLQAESIKVRKPHIYRECLQFIKSELDLMYSEPGCITGARVHQVQQSRGSDEEARYQVDCKHDITGERVSLMAPHVAFYLAYGHWLFDEV